MRLLRTVCNIITTLLSLKAPITTAADDKFCNIFSSFRQKEGMIFHENRLPADDFHEISCLIYYFWKSSKIWNCLLLQIIGGTLWVKRLIRLANFMVYMVTSSLFAGWVILTLKSPISAKVVCFCHQLKCLLSLFFLTNSEGPDQTASVGAIWNGSTLFISQIMLEKYAADNLSRWHFQLNFSRHFNG